VREGERAEAEAEAGAQGHILPHAHNCAACAAFCQTIVPLACSGSSGRVAAGGGAQGKLFATSSVGGVPPPPCYPLLTPLAPGGLLVFHRRTSCLAIAVARHGRWRSQSCSCRAAATSGSKHTALGREGIGGSLRTHSIIGAANSSLWASEGISSLHSSGDVEQSCANFKKLFG
jgi:hypothetical protein